VTRILIHGAGRMAHRVLANLSDYESFELVGLVSRNQPEVGPGVQWFSALEKAHSKADLLIDFTLPGGTRDAAQWCASNKVALLSGTTGLKDEDISALKTAALEVPVLWAPNLSHGVALMTALVRQAAEVLGTRANISITDIHHQHKLDAPSGTALALAAATKAGRAASSSGNGASEPIISSVREGEVIGEHTVSFSLADEVIEITHKALDRDVFAKGALKAAEWLVTQPPGYYSISDCLGLR